MKSSDSQRGMTLLEMTIATALGVVVFATIWSTFTSAIADADFATAVAAVDSRLRTTIDRVSAEVSDSGQEEDGTDHVLSHPKAASTNAAQLRFEPRIDFTGDPVNDWGTAVTYVLQSGALEIDANGIDDDGDSLVDEFQLVRVLLDGTTTLVLDNVRNFVATRLADEDVITIQIDVERSVRPETGLFTRSLTTTFSLNNRD